MADRKERIHFFSRLAIDSFDSKRIFALLGVLLTLGVMGLFWGIITVRGSLNAALWMALASLHALLAWLLCIVFVRPGRLSASSFHLAYLLSLAAAPILWLIFSGGLPPGGTFVPNIDGESACQLMISTTGAVLGAFIGGLAAAGLYFGWYENNSPPTPQQIATVCEKHLVLIGEPAPEPLGKRLFDLSLAAFGLLLSAPLWLLSVFIIWWQDPGPVLFVKNSVGKGGVNFRQYKLRTMVRGAEEHTGPVLSDENDSRVLPFGAFLRKTALDELPQLINILLGEMSFVGPRPQRTILVNNYLNDIPEYALRHSVLPGLSGLAQVAGDYFLTPRQKLRFDRLYIKHRSLGFDIKLLVLAFLLTFWYRWIPGWDGRLPRALMRLGSRKKP